MNHRQWKCNCTYTLQRKLGNELCMFTILGPPLVKLVVDPGVPDPQYSPKPRLLQTLVSTQSKHTQETIWVNPLTNSGHWSGLVTPPRHPSCKAVVCCSNPAFPPAVLAQVLATSQEKHHRLATSLHPGFPWQNCAARRCNAFERGRQPAVSC